jgi:hypothetical protein
MVPLGKPLPLGYEIAVTLHNQQWDRHVTYQEDYERRLRAVVTKLAPVTSGD